MRVRREDNAISSGEIRALVIIHIHFTLGYWLVRTEKPSFPNCIWHWHKKKVRWQGRSDLEMLGLLKLTCDGSSKSVEIRRKNKKTSTCCVGGEIR